MKKLKLSLACIFLCTATAFANIEINEINFPDENFRNWILEHFWGRNVITDTEIANVTRIEVRNKNIEDLTGIQFFTNLTRLSVSYNQLTNLDVSNLTNLEELFVWGNQLTSLDVSNLVNLTRLDIGRNQFKSIDVSNLLNLTTLNIT